MSTHLIAAAPEMLVALRGDDPDAPAVIQPLSWLYSAIQDLKDPKALAEAWETDPEAMQTMIGELEQLYERGIAAIAKATGAA